MTVGTANSGTATSGYATASVKSGVTSGKAQYGATVELQYTASAGYEFVNWTSSDVTVNSANKFTMPAKAVTVTANFKPTTYTISYTLNNGTATNPTSYTVETDTFTLNNPTRTGYTFKGWSGTGLTGDENKTVTIAKGSTGDRTYTANWTLNTYTISYELNGGTAANPTSYTVETDTFTLNNPTRTGYTFKGWSGTGLTGDENKTVTIAKGSTGNK